MIVGVVQRQPSQVRDHGLRGVESLQPLLRLRDLPRLDQLRESMPPSPHPGRASCARLAPPTSRGVTGRRHATQRNDG